MRRLCMAVAENTRKQRPIHRDFSAHPCLVVAAVVVVVASDAPEQDPVAMLLVTSDADHTWSLNPGV